MILPLAALSIALASLKGFSLCSDLCSSIDVDIRYFGNVSSFVVDSFFNVFRFSFHGVALKIQSSCSPPTPESNNGTPYVRGRAQLLRVLGLHEDYTPTWGRLSPSPHKLGP